MYLGVCLGWGVGSFLSPSSFCILSLLVCYARVSMDVIIFWMHAFILTGFLFLCLSFRGMQVHRNSESSENTMYDCE